MIFFLINLTFPCPRSQGTKHWNDEGRVCLVFWVKLTPFACLSSAPSPALYIDYCWLFNNRAVGVLTNTQCWSCSGRSCIIYGRSSMYTVPLYPWFCILWIQQSRITYSYSIYYWEKKNPCLSGPAWFKPVLFKSQLYVYLGQMLASTARRSFYFKWTTSLMRKSVPLYF